MVGIKLSFPILENLTKHLACIDEEKTRLLDRLFPHICKERADFEQDLDHYVEQVNLLIKSAHQTETDVKELPFVVIGSEVTVYDLRRKKPLKFRLIPPGKEKAPSGCISCLSPVGRSMLLRKVDEEVSVEVPAGQFQYRVQSIQM